jgi:nucleotide-binding universal stress UspA family protein
MALSTNGCSRLCYKYVKQFNAELYAIHVVKDPAYMEMFSFGIYDFEIPFHRISSLEHIRQKAKEWFDELKAKANEKNIQLSKAELIGSTTSVEAAIVDYAEKNILFNSPWY